MRDAGAMGGAGSQQILPGYSTSSPYTSASGFGLSSGDGRFSGGSGGMERELDENGYPLPDPSLRSAAPGVSEGVIDCQRLDGMKERRWARENFPWSGRLAEINHAVFGNRKFRPNQIQVINATVSGEDVFVLMPTGTALSRSSAARAPHQQFAHRRTASLSHPNIRARINTGDFKDDGLGTTAPHCS